jgi:WD40 repeat protein
MDEHEDELESIDFLSDSKIFVTGGKDGCVKVRNIKKELVREIKFPEPITSVCFLNSEGDILVGHVGKVSSILAKDYKPFEIKSLSLPGEEEI